MENPNLPLRIFADREEPVGDRVNCYFKLNFIRVVLRALQPEELAVIRPTFGGLLDLNYLPTFSGKLAHFLLYRQLVVGKNHEIWVVFGGKPIKFSLREYGIVTGLRCSPIPQIDRDTLTSKPRVTPYWFTLFGGEENMTGERLVSLLKRPKNLSSELRVKYACLLLVNGLLCRRSFHMKIPKEHVEMIRNLDYFLNYPWGRHSFDMTMQCIKSRSITQLAQSTVAVQDFLHALQLVVRQAVPAASLAVGDGTDSESGDEESRPIIALKLDKLWELDEENTVDVISILSTPEGEVGDTDDYSWADEGDDSSVAHMEKLINDGFVFCRDMFEGGQIGSGAPAAPNGKIPGKAKRKGKSKSSLDESELVGSSRNKKARLHRDRHRPTSSDSNSKTLQAVSAQIKAAMSECKTMISNSVRSGFQHVETRLHNKLEKVVPLLVRECLKSKDSDEVIKDVLKNLRPSDVLFDEPGENVPEGSTVGVKKSSKKPMEVDGDITLDDDLGTGNSAGENVSLEEHNQSDPVVSETDPVQNSTGDADVNVVDVLLSSATNPKFIATCHKTEPTRELDFGAGRYLKDVDLLTIPISIDPCRPDVMDSCVMVMRDIILSGPNFASNVRADILPCSFVVSLAKQFSKFKKISRKDSFEFDPDFVDYVRIRMKETGKQWVKDIDSICFPFNIDRTRWIGVCIEFSSHRMTVFDPSVSEMRSSRLKPELDFICEMFSFLVCKSAVNNGMKNFSSKVISFKRDTSVVQASSGADTGILSLLFIEAHVLGEIDKVYDVTNVILPERAEQLVVDMYEHCCGDIDLTDR